MRSTKKFSTQHTAGDAVCYIAGSFTVPCLHGDEPVVHLHLLCEEVGADGGLVLAAELLVHVLVHQRRLADAAGSVQQAGRQRERGGSSGSGGGSPCRWRRAVQAIQVLDRSICSSWAERQRRRRRERAGRQGTLPCRRPGKSALLTRYPPG